MKRPRFQKVGTIQKVREGDTHVVGEVPGKVPFVIACPEAGEMLGYFPADRRPKVGARIGAHGHNTLRELVEAMGGELELWVRFPDDAPVRLSPPSPAPGAAPGRKRGARAR